MSSKNLKSFSSLNKHYLDGNFSRIIIQTLITLPILYFIKFKADQLVVFDISSALDDADISYLIIFVPYIICYFLVKIEFSNTNYDYEGDKFVDKASGIERMGIIWGIWYGTFGWIGAILIQFLIIGLRVVYILITDIM